MRDLAIFNFIQEITKPLFLWRMASAKVYAYEIRRSHGGYTANQYYAECRRVSKAEDEIEAAIKKFADQRGWTLTTGLNYDE